LFWSFLPPFLLTGNERRRKMVSPFTVRSSFLFLPVIAWGLFAVPCFSLSGSGSRTCTVTFDALGGGPAPERQTVVAGGTALEPAAPTKALPSDAGAGLYLDAVFEGWYTDAAFTPESKYDFDTPVTGDLKLYAKWMEPAPVDLTGPGSILENALAWIAGQTLTEPEAYTILLAEDCSLAGVTSPNINIANAVITLRSKAPVELSLSSLGALFYIGAGELILDNNITLKGLPANDNSLVLVSGTSASLRMKVGAKISGNTTSGLRGSGVSVVLGGSFSMEGGKISGNTAAFGGGGVSVLGSSFSMEGGKISGNTATFGGGGVDVLGDGNFTMSGGEISGNRTVMSGGGVSVRGSFSMEGGKISGNIVSTTGGGGVAVNDGSFSMEGGEISGNKAVFGGGVDVFGSGSFTMSGGEIFGNTAVAASSAGYGGGGVYVHSGAFTMEGGKISGNTAFHGGGVSVNSSFAMSGGEISDNSAFYGGGVFVNGASFNKTGNSVVYGDTDSTHTPGSTENTATSGNTCGHAVYFAGSSSLYAYYRDDTLRAGDDISTGDMLPANPGDRLNNWIKQ
jgi:uncharacterized repeat protein (TIGR02543 family)